MSCWEEGEKDKKILKRSQVTYNEYLKIPELINLQVPLSEANGNNLIHDENLFIIIHQTYELWFKLIIIELDSVRELLMQAQLDEGNTLTIVSRLNRIVKTQKILVDQIEVLETMTAQDFDKFRTYISPASGFQSWQFRLIENKLGVCKEKRIKHNNNNYSEAEGLTATEKNKIKISENELSLLSLVDNWLSRTPGLELNGFNFTGKFQKAVSNWLNDLEDEANLEECDEVKDMLLNHLKSKRDVFDYLFDEEKHTKLKKMETNGSLTKVFKELFSYIFIDNHAIMVNRMIGGKIGTGGSSGYHYLLATASDRYKVFLDLFDLATFIIPQEYMPKLDDSMKRCLSIFTETIESPREDVVNSICCGETAQSSLTK